MSYRRVTIDKRSYNKTRTVTTSCSPHVGDAVMLGTNVNGVRVTKTDTGDLGGFRRPILCLVNNPGSVTCGGTSLSFSSVGRIPVISTGFPMKRNNACARPRNKLFKRVALV